MWYCVVWLVFTNILKQDAVSSFRIEEYSEHGRSGTGTGNGSTDSEVLLDPYKAHFLPTFFI
jgi:hypothetical protein